ncbi:MAG: ABC transporter ATP-binding protein [Sumerlaeia bacterium]
MRKIDPPQPPASRRERWQQFKRTLPDVVEIARPQARLWLFGLGLMLINRLAGLVLPYIPKVILDEAIPQESLRLLYAMVGLALLAAIVQGLTAYALTQTITKAGQRLINDWRKRIHTHVTRLPLKYFEEHKVGEVVSRILSDIQGIRNLLGTGMVDFLGGMVSAVFVIAILFWMDWMMTVTIAGFLGGFAFVTGKAFGSLRPIYRERQKLAADLSGRLTEGIGGARVVKAFHSETAERAIFGQKADAFLGAILSTIHTSSWVALVTKLLLGSLGATIFLVGGHRMMAGELSAGEMLSYLLYLGILVGPISSLVQVGTSLSEVFAGIDRVKETMGEAPEDADEAEREAIGRVTGRIAFEDVWFEYEENKPVIRGVSFIAEPGSVTALVGPSGSGKSTLISLLSAFRAPRSGTIRVDGMDLQRIRLGAYRAQLGCVLQETFLFSGTVRENIAYARPGASKEDIEEAARLANCAEFVESLPEGFETVIGERGVKLSGGQRQRLAIARALLADPRLLILDEATSALDTASEQKIQEGLEKLMAGRTTFVIAHRLSTIRHASQILVLMDGEIVERGTHGELMAAGGRYAEMVRRQHQVEENVFRNDGEDDDSPESPVAEEA